MNDNEEVIEALAREMAVKDGHDPDEPVVLDLSAGARHRPRWHFYRHLARRLVDPIWAERAEQQP